MNRDKFTSEKSTGDRSVDKNEIRTLLHNDESKTEALKAEKISDNVSDLGEYEYIGDIKSPDGGWGWMVVLGSFFVHLLTDGMLYSFGILYTEFLTQYSGGKGETALIGSLASGLQLLIGPIAGVLTNRFGSRATTIAGAMITFLGFVLSAFSTSLYFLLFSFGILSGLGFGLTYLPAVVIVSHYFEKKRTFAMGLASCGSGIGAFILNPLSKYLIDEYGWRGTLIIQAGILLNCILCGALFRPLTEQHPKKAKVEEREMKILTKRANVNLRNKVFKTEILTSSEYSPELETDERDDAHFQISYDASQCQSHSEKSYSEETEFHLNKRELTNSQREDGSAQAYQRNTSKESVHNGGQLQKKATGFAAKLRNKMSQLCNLSQYKDVTFIIYLISNVLISFNLLIPFIFLYDRSIETGIDIQNAKWLGSIIGITNTAGRVISGIIADKLKINKIMLFSTTITVVGISVIICPLCTNFTSLVAFSCVFGLSFGIYIPLMSVAIVDILGKQMLTNAFGLLLMLKGLANLSGPPFAGWLYEKTGKYTVPFIFAGINISIAGAILVPVICIKKCKRYNKSEIDERVE